MNIAWGIKEDRKRGLISWGSAFLFYLAVFLGLLFSVKSLDTVLADTAGPVMVRLGSPEGMEARPAVEPVKPETPPVEQPEPVQPDKTPQPDKPVPEKPKPVEPEKPETKPVEKPVEKPLPAVVKGSEQGNTLDMTFDATAGMVGRNLYIPIYLSMPIPNTLQASLIERFTLGDGTMYTREERIKIVAKHYERDGALYRLKKQPAFPERSEVWLAMEGAGYNLKKAEYKTERNLQPVSLKFTVGPVAGTTRALLENVEITVSSGDSMIDAAVLYGFSRASFFNSTDRSISGVFVYRFD